MCVPWYKLWCSEFILFHLSWKAAMIFVMKVIMQKKDFFECILCHNADYSFKKEDLLSDTMLFLYELRKNKLKHNRIELEHTSQYIYFMLNLITRNLYKKQNFSCFFVATHVLSSVSCLENWNNWSLIWIVINSISIHFSTLPHNIKTLKPKKKKRKVSHSTMDQKKSTQIWWKTFVQFI